jgi:formylglycine-generating enzyme required for sulfatase activity/tRNA A-37 threonylcarbamoyl transferase component Bud32/dienelactone hydrolase
MTDTISHYRIEREIGRGGMGVVYAAVDTRLGRVVAIKMLPADAMADADRHRRFLQEARSASALNHPGIVTIYEVDDEAGVTFIAMELVDGTPLDRLLADGPLPIGTALDYAIQAAAALEAAHAGGLIHRDIKPANLIITRDGRLKILDFGLAKLVQHPSADATITALATLPGSILGTAAYMSPEQAQGRPVDTRSDIFSFGAVVYEMLAGRRPFTGQSSLAVITAILHEAPPPLPGIRPDISSGVDAIVQRALAKAPEARYATAAEMRADLTAAQARLTRPPDAVWRRPAVLAAVALVLAAGAAFATWEAVQARRARWAREDVIPRIERLEGTSKSLDEVALALSAERYAPDEIARVRKSWVPITLRTDPPGATVEIKNYADLNEPWQPLGVSPIALRMLPIGYYRMRITKPGFGPLEIAMPPEERQVSLAPRDSAPPGMVRAPGGLYGYGVAPPVPLPDFWIDRLETTNREFKRFVDAGGYRDPKYWREPFLDAHGEISFDDATARFRDTTGRPGPSTWELGNYPDGQADFPVGGLSWFEAAAYAQFTRKSLPTLYHWFRAAGVDEIYSDILRLSNFDGKGPVTAGARQGLAPWGALDMAGNVKEWCSNLDPGTGRRYILGAAWNEPSYRFSESDAQNPWARTATFGVRLVTNLGDARAAGVPVASVNPDPKSVVPVSDAEFELYRRFYAYDRTAVDPRVTAVDDSSPDWRKETVSFTAAYGGERVPAYFFVPKHATPPYQTVVFFPSAYARETSSSAYLDLATFDFIVKSGRALLYPVYQNTFERRITEPGGPNRTRDIQVQWAKDVFRAVDYLETRKDVDMQRLGYYSQSMGAFFGPIPVSQEPRIKVAVFTSAGLRYKAPPEIQPANFMPRVKVPVLLVDGRDDFAAPLPAQQRFMDLLGTPPADKKHVVLEGGHVPNDFKGLIREVLDWYDKYLGRVR